MCNSITYAVFSLLDQHTTGGHDTGIIVTSAGMMCNGSEHTFDECDGDFILATEDSTCNHFVHDIRIECSGW